MATPWELANMFYQANTNAASQMRGSADNMLMALFSEEAARQRPYATMPARLAEAQLDRINAEPFAERAAARRFRHSKAGQEAETGEDGVTVDADGNEVIIVGGKVYPVP